MKFIISIVLTFIMFTTVAYADKALILNADEQKIFAQVVDTAIRGGGIQIAPAAVYLLNKLNAAPEVKEIKEQTEEPKK